MQIIKIETEKMFDVMFEHVKDCNDDLEMHEHDCYELFYLVSGDVNYMINSKIYKIEQGSLIFTVPSENHKIILRSNKSYERMCIRFNYELISWSKQLGIDLSIAFDVANRMNHHLNCRLIDKDELLNLMNKIEKCYHSEQLIDKTLLLTYITEIIINVAMSFTQ